MQSRNEKHLWTAKMSRRLKIMVSDMPKTENLTDMTIFRWLDINELQFIAPTGEDEHLGIIRFIELPRVS